MRLINAVDGIALFGLVIMLVGVYFWIGWAAALTLLGLVVFVVSVYIASKIPFDVGGG